MKYLVFFLLLWCLPPAQSTVFICGKNGAKKYHYSETCRGLSNCKHEVYKTTLKEAKGLGLDLCGWED